MRIYLAYHIYFKTTFANVAHCVYGCMTIVVRQLLIWKKKKKKFHGRYLNDYRCQRLCDYRVQQPLIWLI